MSDGGTWFPFHQVTSGVRQGGVLSPYFFSIFVDDIVNKITECNLGCYIRNICTSIFLYADDTIFLSPSVSGFAETTEGVWNGNKMEINASKTVCMRTGPRYTCARVTLCNGTQLQWVDTSGVFRGPCACPPFNRPWFFMMVFLAVLLIFSSKTSKFRHSVTKSVSFWGTSSPDPLPGLCPWTPLGDFRPPDPLGTLLSHILNTPLVNTYTVHVYWVCIFSDDEILNAHSKMLKEILFII